MNQNSHAKKLVLMNVSVWSFCLVGLLGERAFRIPLFHHFPLYHRVLLYVVFLTVLVLLVSPLIGYFRKLLPGKQALALCAADVALLAALALANPHYLFYLP